MGILNNDTTIVDAVLTKVGKRKLDEGTGLNISSFALSDDFTHYGLYNPDHPSGSAQYGEAIENIPLPEAVTSAGNALRFHLTTRDRNILFNPIIRIPGITTDNNTVRLEDQGFDNSFTFRPTLVNGPGGTGKFIFKVSDTTNLMFRGAQKLDLSPSHIAFPREQDVAKPAEFVGTHLEIAADTSDTAFAVLVSISEENTGATEVDAKVIVDANILRQPTDKLKA